MPSRLRISITLPSGHRRVGRQAIEVLRRLRNFKGPKSDWQRVYVEGRETRNLLGLHIYSERRGIPRKDSGYHQSSGRRGTNTPKVHQDRQLAANRRQVRAAREAVRANPFRPRGGGATLGGLRVNSLGEIIGPAEPQPIRPGIFA